MPPTKNPTATGDRVSWNSLDGASTDPITPSSQFPQLPPIIAQHLWQPRELALIEAAMMLAITMIGGAGHG